MSETEIFKALADPTRRAVFEKLAAGAQNGTELRRGMSITQPAISHHLGVLRQAGLVREEPAGRAVLDSIAPGGMKPLHDWMARYSQFWPERIADLNTLLKEMDQ